MRIGISLSFLLQGPSLTQRGVGRYIVQQILATSTHRQGHEIIGLCPAEVELAAVAPELSNAPALTLHRLEPNPNADPHAVLRTAVKQLGLDVVHCPTPLFEPFRADLGTAVVATLYDAIPLAYPMHYLAAEGDFTPIYLESARQLHRADHVLVISEATRRDALAYFGVAEEATTVAYPYADSQFEALPQSVIDQRLERLRTSLKLPTGSFILAVPHVHHSKNIAGLLDAYALAVLSMTARVPLVIACSLKERDRSILDRMVATRGLADHVIITGYVSDAELGALYAAARVYLHLSHVEGFGLPVLEAMQSGTAVIASHNTSTREIVGDAGLLVDPLDPQGIAAALVRLLASPTELASYEQRGRERARLFGPERLAAETLSAYEAAQRARQAARAPVEVAARQIETLDQIQREWLTHGQAPTTVLVQAVWAPTDSTPPENSHALDPQRSVNGLIVHGLWQTGCSRTVFANAHRTLLHDVASDGLLVGSVLLRESGPSDVELIDLGLPVFDMDEWLAWLGPTGFVKRVDDLGPLNGAIGPLSDALAPGGLARLHEGAVLPGGRALYLDGVAVGLYAFHVNAQGMSDPWPLAREIRLQRRSTQARRIWLERIQAEHAYLLEVTVMNLTPRWARRFPAWLLKPIRHARRLARLGRAHEAQAVLTQELIRKAASNPPQVPLTEQTLIAALKASSFSLDQSDRRHGPA